MFIVKNFLCYNFVHTLIRKVIMTSENLGKKMPKKWWTASVDLIRSCRNGPLLFRVASFAFRNSAMKWGKDEYKKMVLKREGLSSHLAKTLLCPYGEFLQIGVGWGYVTETTIAVDGNPVASLGKKVSSAKYMVPHKRPILEANERAIIYRLGRGGGALFLFECSLLTGIIWAFASPETSFIFPEKGLQKCRKLKSVFGSW